MHPNLLKVLIINVSTQHMQTSRLWMILDQCSCRHVCLTKTDARLHGLPCHLEIPGLLAAGQMFTQASRNRNTCPLGSLRGLNAILKHAQKQATWHYHMYYALSSCTSDLANLHKTCACNQHEAVGWLGHSSVVRAPSLATRKAYPGTSRRP